MKIEKSLSSKNLRGKLIVIEGIDGAGTTTQTNLLHDYIKSLSKYNDVLTTHEPWRSNEIKRRLVEERDSYSGGREMVELYVDDRRTHLDRIILPNIEAGVFVLSDRYHLSTFAYQQTQGIGLEVIKMVHEEKRIMNPDLTIFVDVDYKVAKRRIDARGDALEKFERDVDFINKLISTYREIYRLSKEDSNLVGRVEIVEGNKSIEEVSRDISLLVHSLIN